MFRRRPIRRPIRPPRGRRPARAPRALIAANQLLQSGKYLEAAERFEAIAHAAETRGGPRAPQFYLQAGRARILGGETERGLTHLKYGLNLLVQRSDWKHLHNAGNRAVSELEQQGMKEEADEIAALLKSNLPENFSPGEMAKSTKKVLLPTHCPSCGGAVRPGEVDWLDDVTAECGYCGSPVREEK